MTQTPLSVHLKEIWPILRPSLPLGSGLFGRKYIPRFDQGAVIEVIELYALVKLYSAIQWLAISCVGHDVPATARVTYVSAPPAV